MVALPPAGQKEDLSIPFFPNSRLRKLNSLGYFSGVVPPGKPYSSLFAYQPPPNGILLHHPVLCSDVPV
jgi:hypothetical protein